MRPLYLASYLAEKSKETETTTSKPALNSETSQRQHQQTSKPTAFSGVSQLAVQMYAAFIQTIVVAKDTQREEKEKALIESWEAHEHGRKEKARLNRVLYQARRKKAEGKELTEEEVKLLHENKAEKYTHEEAGKKGAGAKGAAAKQPPPAAKKGTQPGAKKDAKDQGKAEEQHKELVIPKSTDHNMAEVKSFLRHMEQPRMKIEQAIDNKEPRVRSDAEFSEIYETCLMTKEDSLSQLERLAKRREDLKVQRDQLYDKKLKGYHDYVEEIKKQYETIKEDFNNINTEAAKRKEDETILVTSLENELIQENALREAIEKAKDHKVDARLIYAAEKYLKNLVIKNACTNLKEKLDTFDEAGVKAQKEFIESHKIELDDDLQLQMEDFFVNIEANPNYIQEKLAELKKQPKAKGGRK